MALDPITASGLIIAGGNLLGSIFGSSKNSSSVDRTNAMNMEIAKYQNDRNLEMWNLQNEYNTPQAQMQRLIDAGLNPNLMYSQGNLGNAGAVANTEGANIQPFTGWNLGVGDAVASGVQAMGNQSVMELQKTQADANRLGMVSETLKQANQATKNAHDEFSLKMARDLQQNSLDVAAQNLANMRAQEQSVISQSNLAEARKALTENQGVLTAYQTKQASAQIDKLYNDMRVANSRLSIAERTAAQDLAIKAFQHRMQTFGIGSPVWSRILNEVTGVGTGAAGMAAGRFLRR